MKKTVVISLCAAVLGAGSLMGNPVLNDEGKVKALGPRSNVQEALDNALPGDVFTLSSGTYYKTWIMGNGGRSGAPVVLKAQVPGTVTISGAAPPSFELAFRKVDGDLYQAPVPWQIRWVMAGKRNLIWYSSLADLKSLGGGLTLDHNIVYVSPERGLRKSTLLKFDCPWRRSYDAATRDLTIVHNTLVNTLNTLYWTRHHFENSIFENNIVQVYRSVAWNLPGLTLSKHNLHSASRANPEHMADLLQAETPGFVSPPDSGAQALPVVPLAEAGLIETPELRQGSVIDFRLKANSPAVDAGRSGKDSVYHHRSRGNAPDLGALELGDAWVFPRPGPRWAVGKMTPWRPPLPPSLDPKWVGLDE